MSKGERRSRKFWEGESRTPTDFIVTIIYCLINIRFFGFSWTILIKRTIDCSILGSHEETNNRTAMNLQTETCTGQWTCAPECDQQLAACALLDKFSTNFRGNDAHILKLEFCLQICHLRALPVIAKSTEWVSSNSFFIFCCNNWHLNHHLLLRWHYIWYSVVARCWIDKN